MFALPKSPSGANNPTENTSAMNTQNIYQNTLDLEKSKRVPLANNLNESFFPPIMLIKPSRDSIPKRIRKVSQYYDSKMETMEHITKKANENQLEGAQKRISTLKMNEEQSIQEEHDQFYQTAKFVVSSQKKSRSRSLQQSFCEQAEQDQKQLTIENQMQNSGGQNKMKDDQMKIFQKDICDEEKINKTNSMLLQSTRFTFASNSNLHSFEHPQQPHSSSEFQQPSNFDSQFNKIETHTPDVTNQKCSLYDNLQQHASQISSSADCCSNNLSQPRKSPFLLAKSFLPPALVIALKERMQVQTKHPKQMKLNQYENRRAHYQSSIQDLENLNNKNQIKFNDSLNISGELNSSAISKKQVQGNAIRNCSATIKQSSKKTIQIPNPREQGSQSPFGVFQEQKQTQQYEPSDKLTCYPQHFLAIKETNNVRSVLAPKCLNTLNKNTTYNSKDEPGKKSPLLRTNKAVENNLTNSRIPCSSASHGNKKDSLFLDLMEDNTLMKFSDQTMGISRKAMNTSRLSSTKENMRQIIDPSWKKVKPKKVKDYSSAFEQSYMLLGITDNSSSLPTRQDTQFSSQPSTPTSIAIKCKLPSATSTEVNRVLSWKLL